MTAKCQRAANFGYVPEPPKVGLEGELSATVCADYPGVTKEQRDNAIFVRCNGVGCDCFCHDKLSNHQGRGTMKIQQWNP